MPIIIGKVKDPGGCWGNMAPFPVSYNDKIWLTTEALFQAMRFDNEEIREEIRSQKSPMAAKMIAKKHRESFKTEPLSEADVDNMGLCLRLKIDQHHQLFKDLIATGNEFIVEDCTRRPHGSGLFWGAALKDGEWVGQNQLGKLWMELRSLIKR